MEFLPKDLIFEISSKIINADYPRFARLSKMTNRLVIPDDRYSDLEIFKLLIYRAMRDEKLLASLHRLFPSPGPSSCSNGHDASYFGYCVYYGKTLSGFCRQCAKKHPKLYAMIQTPSDILDWLNGLVVRIYILTTIRVSPSISRLLTNLFFVARTQRKSPDCREPLYLYLRTPCYLQFNYRRRFNVWPHF